MTRTLNLGAAALLLAGSALGALTMPQDGAAADPSGWDALLSPADDLLARHDCLACHAPDSDLRAALDPRGAPVLEGATSRVSMPWLIAFLEDPRALRPDTHHPHQLADIPGGSRRQVAEDLAHFLARPAGASVPAIAAFETDAQTLERGRVLFHSVGCVACHGPLESMDELEVSLADLDLYEWEDEEEGDTQPVRPGVLEPRLTDLPPDLSSKYGPVQLAAFLSDPVAHRPSGHCPSMSLDDGESIAIASYLLLDQAGEEGEAERVPGLRFHSYELENAANNAFSKMATGVAASSGVAMTISVDDRPRDNGFGLRFSGWIEIPEDGRYSFHLRSDDGSRLHLDGEVVIDNGGTHAPRTRSAEVELETGLHAILVEMFEVGGGEEVSLEWQGPGIARGPVPAEAFSHRPLLLTPRVPAGGAAGDFAVDPTRAERGAEAFAQLGCAACHAVDGVPIAAPAKAKTIAQIAAERPTSFTCLGPDGRYDFEEAEAGMLFAAVMAEGEGARPRRSPAEEVRHTLARRNCYGCHRRDDIGGVHPDVMPYFRGDEGAELGDQGRFPPVLTALGRKLKPAVLADAVAGHEKVRPYLMTRMPRMGRENLEGLAGALMAADEAPAADPDLAKLCPPGAVDEGRRLAGDRGGLGCVQCHDFRGTASLGVRAVDMGTMHRRLRFGWFRELLLDPANVDLDGRMANLWIDGASPVEGIAGGDREAQIERLWCWLAEGPDSMAPPPGLDTGEWAFELTPDGGPRLVSVFMRDVSPRVLCVGTPEGVHSAFDVEHGRLAKVWRGRFMNVIGTWRGRAGALESPGAAEAIDLPAGTAVGTRPSLTAPWDEEAVGVSLGRRLNPDGSMSFRYRVGELEVEETIRPTSIGVRLSNDVEPETRPGIERVFTVRAPAGSTSDPVMARVGLARRFERAGRGLWRTNEGDWPLYVLDESGVTSAQVVTPAPEAADGGSGERSTVLDARDRQVSRRRGSDDGAPPMAELRIPILLTPAGDGSGELVGRTSWKYAW